jgi:crotonobetainyl-CoA:carnitine CoA-transferase CaiB-like acyl-CoA transferase
MTSGLGHLHVLELGGGLAASMVGKLVADLGVTVVKVEPPGGDPTRQRGPFRGQQVDPETSGTFLDLNSNKRSMRLDLTQPAGRASLEVLGRQADLLVHQVSPQEMIANGLDYTRVRQMHPRLVSEARNARVSREDAP